MTDRKPMPDGKDWLEKALREKALRSLARREHSRHELKQKLFAWLAQQASAAEAAPEEIPEALVEKVVQDFQQRGWLSDARFTEQLVHARQRKFGVAKIAHELHQHGLDETEIQAALHKARAEELQHAHRVWQKKYGALPENRMDYAKQARFLQGRGFGFDVIKQILNQNPETFE